MHALQLFLVFVGMGALALLALKLFGLWSVTTFAVCLFVVGFPLRALVALSREGFRPLGLTLAAEDVVSLSWVGLAAAAGFLIGAALVHAAARGTAEPPTEEEPSRVLRSRALLLLLLAALAVSVQCALFAGLYGSLSRALFTFAQRTMIGTHAVGPLGTLAAEMWHVFVPLTLAAFYYAVRAGSRLLIVCTLVAVAGLLLWVGNINGRAASAIVLWSLGMVTALLLRRKVTFAHLAIGAGVVWFVTIGGLALRLTTQLQLPLEVALDLVWDRAALTVSDALPMADAFYIAAEYVRLTGHHLFEVFGAPLTVLIPRDIWPSKPVFLPQLINQAFFHATRSGMPVGLAGESYIALGPLGVVILPAALGAAVAAADRVMGRWSHGTLLRCYLIFVCVNTTLSGVRVGFQSALIAPQIGLLFLPVLMLLAAMIVKRRAAFRQTPRPRLGQ